jgi:RNA polymerase II subunit A-like phosphatase
MAEIERDNEEDIPAPTLSTDVEGTGKGKEKEKEGGDGETTTPPGSPRPAKRKREPNPNAEALKDVARFTLADDPAPGQGRRKVPERYYYTKPRSVYPNKGIEVNTNDRPGLQHFLDTMSEFYEMHVYTMGTRTYANAICKVIDPDGKIFGDRILSRDESGSKFSWFWHSLHELIVDFTSKNLKRLFPTDQSMVVVIDDRQDVWGDCPNLLKVVPCKLFYSRRQDEADYQTTSS